MPAKCSTQHQHDGEPNKNNDEAGKSMLFEMQISGFFNDLPPLENDDVDVDSSPHLRQDAVASRATGGSSGWFSQMLGLSSASSASNIPTLSPIWTYRYCGDQV